MPTTTGTFDNVRGMRYCEIFVVTHDVNQIRAACYNTMGCNDCPQGQWQALDPDALKEAFKADAIIMNGPRHWVMDKLSVELLEGEGVVSFDGLQLRLVAVLRISDPRFLHGGRKPYMELTIERKTTYVFSSGKLVYELVDPDGKVYIMQAYAQIVDPALTEEQLATLASRLKPPEHRQYRVRRLDQDFTLRTDGVAHVVQDDFENTYQRIDS